MMLKSLPFISICLLQTSVTFATLESPSPQFTGASTDVFSHLCKDRSMYNPNHIPLGLYELNSIKWGLDSTRNCDLFMYIELNIVDPNVEGWIWGYSLDTVACTDEVTATMDFYAKEAGCCSDGISRCATVSPTPSTISPTMSPSVSPISSSPSVSPISSSPSVSPIAAPTISPTMLPTATPTSVCVNSQAECAIPGTFYYKGLRRVYRTEQIASLGSTGVETSSSGESSSGAFAGLIAAVVFAALAVVVVGSVIAYHYTKAAPKPSTANANVQYNENDENILARTKTGVEV